MMGCLRVCRDEMFWDTTCTEAYFPESARPVTFLLTCPTFPSNWNQVSLPGLTLVSQHRGRLRKNLCKTSGFVLLHTALMCDELTAPAVEPRTHEYVAEQKVIDYELYQLQTCHLLAGVSLLAPCLGASGLCVDVKRAGREIGRSSLVA